MLQTWYPQRRVSNSQMEILSLKIIIKQSKNFVRGQQLMSTGRRETRMVCRSLEMIPANKREGKRTLAVWARAC